MCISLRNRIEATPSIITVNEERAIRWRPAMTKETCIPAGNSFPIRHSQPNRIEKGHLSNSNTGIAPRLLNRRQAASYCGLSIQGFSKWVKSGRLPRSIPGTARWDLEAINAALDAAGGIGLIRQEDAFDKWKRERNEKRTSRHS